jgi:uncharacterized protein YkwD
MDIEHTDLRTVPSRLSTEDVLARANEIEREHGPDVDEALDRWETSGGHRAGAYAASWLSVAFLFARRNRQHKAESWRIPDADRQHEPDSVTAHG